MYIFGSETHLDAGVTSAFVIPSVTIAGALTSTFIGVWLLGKGHKDSDYTAMNAVVHRRLRTENSSWWQSFECCNDFCFPSGHHCLLDSNSMVITSCDLVGMSRKTSCVHYMGSL